MTPRTPESQPAPEGQSGQKAVQEASQKAGKGAGKKAGRESTGTRKPIGNRKPTGTRRREIAAAVLRVIGEHGATSLTAATVAREVGVTSGALFRHFASLDEILEAAVELGIAKLEATIPSSDAPPLDRLRELALARVELIGKEPGLAWLLLSDQVYLTVPQGAVRRLRALVKRSKAFLLDALQEAAHDGSVRDDLAPEVLLVIFTGTVHALIGGRGAHRSAPRGAKPPQPARVVDDLLALLAPGRRGH